MKNTYKLILAEILLAGAPAARAQFTVCNDTGLKLAVAMGYQEGGRWISRGWTLIDASSCAVTVGGPLQNRYYYYHAESMSSDFRWGDEAPFCVTDRSFTLTMPCTGDARMEKFAKADTGAEATTYGVSLTCANWCTQHNGNRLLLSSPSISRSMSWGDHHFRTGLSGWIDVSYGQAGLTAFFGITADLSQLQNHLPGIIQSSYDHDDDCDYKLRVHTISLTPDGASARVFVAAHYESWWCGPLGSKGRTFEQNGSATLQITPFVANGAAQLGARLLGADADGILGQALRNQIVGPWLMDALRDLIPPTVSLGDINSALPPELRPFALTITGLQFVDRGGGRLGLQALGRVDVAASRAAEVFQQLGQR